MGTKVRVNRNRNQNQSQAPSPPPEEESQMTTAASEDAALEEAEVVDTPDRTQFQSDEAHDAATVVDANDGADPAAADVSGKTNNEDGKTVQVATPVIPSSTQNRMRKVRPLRTEKRVRIGNSWYNFEAGKDCLVPNHVYLLLRSKGLFS